MIRKLWTRAMMLIGAVGIIGVASAASAAPAKAQPPIVVVRPPYYGYGYGWGPRVVVVGHPYWRYRDWREHEWREHEWREHEWREHRDWR